jgi:hypothetical protein
MTNLERLIKADVARAAAKAVSPVGTDPVTKADFAEWKAATRADLAELKAELVAELVKVNIGTLVAVTAVFWVIVKLL